MLILETLILLGAFVLISGLVLSGIARWLHHR